MRRALVLIGLLLVACGGQVAATPAQNALPTNTLDASPQPERAPTLPPSWTPQPAASPGTVSATPPAATGGPTATRTPTATLLPTRTRVAQTAAPAATSQGSLDDLDARWLEIYFSTYVAVLGIDYLLDVADDLAGGSISDAQAFDAVGEGRTLLDELRIEVAAWTPGDDQQLYKTGLLDALDAAIAVATDWLGIIDSVSIPNRLLAPYAGSEDLLLDVENAMHDAGYSSADLAEREEAIVDAFEDLL